jgi:hypothetical protein
MSPLAAPARLSRSDGERRAIFLREVLAVLYPRGGGGREYLVLPHARRPRLLVPAGAGAAAAGALRYRPRPSCWPGRLAQQAGALALHTGAAAALLRQRVRVEPAGSIEPHLQRLLGHPVVLGIQIGAARANRKPVLHLLHPDGWPVGFAKLGTRPLTRTLVRAEATALATVSRLRFRELTVPELHHSGRWCGHELLVQSPLPAWRRPERPDPARLAAAMHELACCHGTGDAPLAGSGYWQQLRGRVTGCATGPGAGWEAGALVAATGSLAGSSGTGLLRYGAWHGDWAPWNMAMQPGTVLLWDWERFDTGVPIGFDALHYDLQHRLASGGDAAEAVRATVAGAARLLVPFGVAPLAARVTGALYLIELAARYLADRQAAAGARLGVLGTWLLPALLHQLAQLGADR